MESKEQQGVATAPTELTHDNVALAYASIREMATSIREFGDKYASSIKDGRSVLAELAEDTQQAADRLLEASSHISEGSSPAMRERIDGLLGKALELCSSAVKRAAEFDEKHRLQVRLVNSLSDAYLQAASGLTRAREVVAGATQQYVRQPLTDATAAVVVGLGHAAAAAEAQASRLSDTDLAKSAGASLQSVGERLDQVSERVAGLKPFEQAMFALAKAREQVAAVRARWADLPPQDVPQEAAAEALATARGALAAVQAAAFARTEGLRQSSQRAIADAQSALASGLAEAAARVQSLRLATESVAERAVRAGSGAVKVVTAGCLGAAGRADARLGLASLVLAVDQRAGAMVPLPLGAARRLVEMLPRAAEDKRDDVEDEDRGKGKASSKDAAASAAAGEGAKKAKDAPAEAPRAMSSQLLEGATVAREGCRRAAGACDSLSGGACVSLPLRAASAADSSLFCGAGRGLWRGAVAALEAGAELARWGSGVFFGERARALHALQAGAAGEAASASGQAPGEATAAGGGGAASAVGWLPPPPPTQAGSDEGSEGTDVEPAGPADSSASKTALAAGAGDGASSPNEKEAPNASAQAEALVLGGMQH